jgi:integrase
MRGGRPYAYSTVRDMYDAAAIKAKVEDTTFHDLRAKSLTDAKRDGKNPTALGGHSSPAMTARYLRNHETVLADPPSFRQIVKD